MTVLETDAPICARTRPDTTDEREVSAIVVCYANDDAVWVLCR